MLLSFLLQFIPLVSAAVLYQRQQVNENPTVGGDPYNGWQTLPQVTDATLYPDWTINQRSGVKIVRLSVHPHLFLLE